jgi:hypothetical protein
MEDRHASEAFITTESGLRPYGLGTFGHMGHRGRRRRLGHGACTKYLKRYFRGFVRSCRKGDRKE